MTHQRLSIGIAAYNEEANIMSLLASLLRQQSDNHELLEIIVVSDGSTDQTVSQAKLIMDPRLVVVDHPDRVGQAVRQNEILQMFKGDTLVMLNADILIRDGLFLSKMTEPFLTEGNIGIVGAKISPLTAENFFERVINNSAILKRDIYEQIDNGRNLYLCHGRARAFSRRFAGQLRFPARPGEDAFSYIQCLQKGFDFFYQPQAEVFYRSPQNLKDHLKQSKRFFRSKTFLETSYKDGERSYYRIPIFIIIKTVFGNFFRYPVLLVVYSAVFVIARVNSIWYKTGPVWEVSLSSKSTLK
jgi:glycosyltransferase involved in cell wall biosynthesis